MNSHPTRTVSPEKAREKFDEILTVLKSGTSTTPEQPKDHPEDLLPEITDDHADKVNARYPDTF